MRLWLAAVVFAAMVVLPHVARPQQSSVSQQASAATAPDASGTATGYFERARKLGFPSAAASRPYVLQAEFTTRSAAGSIDKGEYADTWAGSGQWRREAVLDRSRFIRSRNGKKLYRLDEGPDAAVLQFVLTAMEPLPAHAISSGAWKMESAMLNAQPVVRIWRGDDHAPADSAKPGLEAYWFDPSGQLVKSSLNGLEIVRSNFQDFDGVQVARHIEVFAAGKVAMRIDVITLTENPAPESKFFAIKGHEWLRPILIEAR